MARYLAAGRVEHYAFVLSTLRMAHPIFGKRNLFLVAIDVLIGVPLIKRRRRKKTDFIAHQLEDGRFITDDDQCVSLVHPCNVRVNGCLAGVRNLSLKILLRVGLFEDMRAYGIAVVHQHRRDPIVRATCSHHRDDDREDCFGSAGVGVIRMANAPNQVFNTLRDGQCFYAGGFASSLGMIIFRFWRRKIFEGAGSAVEAD